MYYQLGAYQRIIELLQVLFPDGKDKLPRLHKKDAQTFTLNELANCYSLSGQPAVADNLHRSIALSREIEDRLPEAVGHREYGRLLAYCGDWATAAAELHTALEQFTAKAAIQPQCVVWAYRALAALLQGNGAAGLAAAQEALRLGRASVVHMIR